MSISTTRPAGSVTPHFEMIGWRPGVDDSAELLLVSESRLAIRDEIGEAVHPDSWDGFSRYRLLAPGDTRPCDVHETPRTVLAFLGVDFRDVVNDLLAECDQLATTSEGL